MRYFHFISPTTDFHSALQTRQCTKIKADGQQCKMRVQIGLPFCWMHRKFHLHLVVKPSTIHGAGDGVFAIDTKKAAGEVVFKAGVRVCYYDGEIISEDTLVARYGDKTAPYGVQTRRDTFEDGAVRRSIGSLFNHKPTRYTNSKLTTNNQGKALIMTTKNIRNGDEMFINYGRQYKMQEQGVQTGTNTRKQL